MREIVYWPMLKRNNKTAHNFFFDILSLIWSKVNCVLSFLSHSNYGGFCIYTSHTSHNNVSIERLQQINRINIAILFMPAANQILNETSLVYNILVFCSPFQWEIPINESFTFIIYIKRVQFSRHVCFNFHATTAESGR